MLVINKDKIVVLGDIHGSFNVVSFFIKKYNLRNTLIIQVGDFGIGYPANLTRDSFELRYLSSELIKTNNILCAIRGNHDNPSYFLETKEIFKNIFLIKDFEVIKTLKENILCIGGAISIDRKVNIVDFSYWKEEGVTYREDLSEFKEITRVVTHTAPDFLPPYVFNQLVYYYINQDETLELELNLERQLMSNMIKQVIENNKDTLKSYYYGHFHYSETKFIDNICFKLLDVNELVDVI